MNRAVLALCFVALFAAGTLPADARVLPGPDDAQGSYDETTTAKWDESSALTHIAGSLSMTYHVDFWLVGRVAGAEHTYIPDGNFTFSVKGTGSQTSEHYNCTVTGTVGGSGVIKPGALIFTPASGEWYFKDIVLLDLRDGLSRTEDCNEEAGPQEWNLNFGGVAAFSATADRISYTSSSQLKSQSCNNDESPTSEIVPSWYPLPVDKSNVRCDVSTRFQFKGRAGISKTTLISPFLPLNVGKKRPPLPSPRPPCRRTDSSGKPQPCATPTPKP